MSTRNSPLHISQETRLLLAIDTCGSTGSVALGRLAQDGTLEVSAERALEGRTYSTTLISAVRSVLEQEGGRLRDISALVVVNGPGSFTGVRVGVSAAKGLAEPGNTPIVAVSRLEVLARKAGTTSAALDAHRNEVFLRLAELGTPEQELLVGRSDLEALERPAQIGLCDEAAESVIAGFWPDVLRVKVLSPTAADALELAVAFVRERQFVDRALLDGHYLRRSDAEIFGTQLAYPK